MSNKAQTKKELNHLLTLGTLALSNKDLIELTKKLRDKYNINVLEKEWNPDGYREKLEKNGTIAKVKSEVDEFMAAAQANDDENSVSKSELIKMFQLARNEKAKLLLDQLWPQLSEILKKAFETLIGDLTVKEVLAKYNLSMLVGDIFNDELTEYIVTDDLQAFPKEYTGTVVEFKDYIIAVAGPLAIQDEVIKEFKEAMRGKFPAGTRSLSDRIAAACLALRNMGCSNKDIARKVFDIDPNRKDYDAELKRKANLVSTKIKKIKEQIDARV